MNAAWLDLSQGLANDKFGFVDKGDLTKKMFLTFSIAIAVYKYRNNSNSTVQPMAQRTCLSIISMKLLPIL